MLSRYYTPSHAGCAVAPGKASDAGPRQRSLADRQLAHSEAMEFLRQAAEAIDQAEASFRDAGVSVEFSTWGTRVSLRELNQKMPGMIEMAEKQAPAEEDDCDAALDLAAELEDREQ